MSECASEGGWASEGGMEGWMEGLKEAGVRGRGGGEKE